VDEVGVGVGDVVVDDAGAVGVGDGAPVDDGLPDVDEGGVEGAGEFGAAGCVERAGGW
jgi:hypothetical protein